MEDTFEIELKFGRDRTPYLKHQSLLERDRNPSGAGKRPDNPLEEKIRTRRVAWYAKCIEKGLPLYQPVPDNFRG